MNAIKNISPSSGIYFEALDGLRAIAALLVLLFHYWVFAGQPNLGVSTFVF